MNGKWNAVTQRFEDALMDNLLSERFKESEAKVRMHQINRLPPIYIDNINYMGEAISHAFMSRSPADEHVRFRGATRGSIEAVQHDFHVAIQTRDLERCISRISLERFNHEQSRGYDILTNSRETLGLKGPTLIFHGKSDYRLNQRLDRLRMLK